MAPGIQSSDVWAPSPVQYHSCSIRHPSRICQRESDKNHSCSIPCKSSEGDCYCCWRVYVCSFFFFFYCDHLWKVRSKACNWMECMTWRRSVLWLYSDGGSPFLLQCLLQDYYRSFSQVLYFSLEVCFRSWVSWVGTCFWVICKDFQYINIAITLSGY